MRRLLAILLVLGSLYFFRGPILRQIGGFLVVSEPAAAGSAVLVFDDLGTVYDEAAELYSAGGVRRVLFFQLQPRRSQQVGAVAMGDVTTRRQLVLRGIPEIAMTVLAASGRRNWDKAAALREWLHENPDVAVAVLCDRFQSRWIRRILDDSLDRADASRVSLRAVADPRYDENNWWQRKEGVIGLFNGYVRFGYAWINGGGEIRPDLPPDEYEQAIGAVP